MGREIIESKIPFLQAKHYKPLKYGRHIQFIVIHSMEAPEKGETAEATARYFQNLTRPASAHYCLDANSIVQCVQTKDIAYAAPGANSNGIHLELAGYARQTRADWLDAYSTAMLKNAAWLCAGILMPKYQIPPTFRPAAVLKQAREATYIKGFTTHWEVTQAFHESTHTDPGTGFPMDQFLEWVKQAQAGHLV